MDANARNQKIEELLTDYFKEASRKSFTFKDENVKELLDAIFECNSWGFREILLVIAIGRTLDNSFKASTGFYDCNPRAIYEGPIRAKLLENGIPHRKSGPLNVAKATVGINKQWATQRRPADVAMKVVGVVGKLEKYDTKELKDFTIYIISKFLDEATRVEDLNIEIDPQADPFYLADLCYSLIDEVPDLGNTPQRIVGELMKHKYQQLNPDLIVEGFKDRASVTNTTSKKPGDITLERENGTILRIFEVTVKPFNKQRVMESYESVRDHDKRAGIQTREVFVICREKDVPQDELDELKTRQKYYFGRLVYRDLTYIYIDIYEWIISILMELTTVSRIEFYKSLNQYISNPSTSEKVKRLWGKIHNN